MSGWYEYNRTQISFFLSVLAQIWSTSIHFPSMYSILLKTNMERYVFLENREIRTKEYDKHGFILNEANSAF